MPVLCSFDQTESKLVLEHRTSPARAIRTLEQEHYRTCRPGHQTVPVKGYQNHLQILSVPELDCQRVHPTPERRR
jgi:hypothetical protein